jgi:hypothetical protein
LDLDEGGGEISNRLFMRGCRRGADDRSPNNGAGNDREEEEEAEALVGVADDMLGAKAFEVD